MGNVLKVLLTCELKILRLVWAATGADIFRSIFLYW
jgi:hypothetical protein